MEEKVVRNEAYKNEEMWQGSSAPQGRGLQSKWWGWMSCIIWIA